MSRLLSFNRKSPAPPSSTLASVTDHSVLRSFFSVSLPVDMYTTRLGILIAQGDPFFVLPTSSLPFLQIFLLLPPSIYSLHFVLRRDPSLDSSTTLPSNLAAKTAKLLLRPPPWTSLSFPYPDLPPLLGPDLSFSSVSSSPSIYVLSLFWSPLAPPESVFRPILHISYYFGMTHLQSLLPLKLFGPKKIIKFLLVGSAAKETNASLPSLFTFIASVSFKPVTIAETITARKTPNRPIPYSCTLSWTLLQHYVLILSTNFAMTASISIKLAYSYLSLSRMLTIMCIMTHRILLLPLTPHGKN